MMTSLSRKTEMTLDNLLQGYVDESYLFNIEITGLTSNSSDVKKGDLFVALAGLTRHAMDFVTDAVNAGAVAVQGNDCRKYVCPEVIRERVCTNTVDG